MMEEIIVGGTEKDTKKVERLLFPISNIDMYLTSSLTKMIYIVRSKIQHLVSYQKKYDDPFTDMFWKGVIKQELAWVMLMLCYSSFPTKTPHATTV